VAHACNPSYSGGRDQEECGSKPLGQTIHKTLSQKYPTQNRAGRVAQVVEHHLASMRPCIQTPVPTKKKKKKKVLGMAEVVV
jgi:hypothetical protein